MTTKVIDAALTKDGAFNIAGARPEKEVRRKWSYVSLIFPSAADGILETNTSYGRKVMAKQKMFVALAAVLVLMASLFLAGCGGGGSGSGEPAAEISLLAAKGPQSGGTLGPSQPVTTGWEIVPVGYSGNFVASDDDQVCYEMSALGYIGEVTSEMRGFKIDPPVKFENDYLEITLSSDGKLLDWITFDATMLAIIVKGGANYNIYDYVGTGLSWDNGLGSPSNRTDRRTGLPEFPQISHYNVCYQPEDLGEYTGCTPGYWRNHADRWVGTEPGELFGDVFGVDLFDPDITLGQAIWMTGGGASALARHATAALLNAYGGVPNEDGTTVDYPYTVDEVIEMVQDAVANGTIEATKDLFEAANELGCPLSGTRAVPVE
jgi:hypothetical protein